MKTFEPRSLVTTGALAIKLLNKHTVFWKLASDTISVLVVGTESLYIPFATGTLHCIVPIVVMNN